MKDNTFIEILITIVIIFLIMSVNYLLNLDVDRGMIICILYILIKREIHEVFEK